MSKQKSLAIADVLGVRYL